MHFDLVIASGSTTCLNEPHPSYAFGNLVPVPPTVLIPSEYIIQIGLLSAGRRGELWHGHERACTRAGQAYIRFCILQVGCLSLMHKVFMAHSFKMLPLRSSSCRLGWVPSMKQRFSHQLSTRTLNCILYWRRQLTFVSTKWILTQASVQECQSWGTRIYWEETGMTLEA